MVLYEGHELSSGVRWTSLSGVRQQEPVLRDLQNLQPVSVDDRDRSQARRVILDGDFSAHDDDLRSPTKNRQVLARQDPQDSVQVLL